MNLQLYLSLGKKVIEIHTMLKFKSSDWMKNYTECNTENIKNAKSESENVLVKLINERKNMENLRKRINIRLVNNDKDYFKYVRKPTFVSQKNFHDNISAIHQISPVLVLNKSIYVGFTVLELSKYLIYDFHYNFTKKKSDGDLLFTDTRSLTFEIESKDAHEKFFKYKHLFASSDYKSKLFDSTNKKNYRLNERWN